MTKKIERIGVLTGGGDAPGLNPAIRSVVHRAADEGIEVVGIYDGWEGLLDGFCEQTWPLTPDVVRTWDRDGGTHLGSSRTNPFRARNDQGARVDRSGEVLRNVEKLGLDALIPIGGEDTLGVGRKISDLGAPVVGIPKTIDKDLSATDYTLGFDTSVRTVADIIEKSRTPAGSHHWVQVVEVMGRHAGHLAYWAGLAGGAYMILIPEHKIEEILDRVDIVALISRHVELKKSGRSYKGKCPFHQEKTASFHVTPELRRFKCFGCQAGGDAIAFVQRYLGKTFVDAVKDLAREVGVDLEAAVDPAAKERARLKEVTDFAAEHFKQRLWEPLVGKKARDYLSSRGVGEEAARAFGLGWAPDEWGELADRLYERGLLDFGEKAGLVARRQKGDGYYDLFRGRLIIPIRSPEGRTIAFGGRLLEGDSGPKYLNSRESKLYNKGEVLYGMDQALNEVRRLKQAVLVEGYFDCIGLHLAGVKNAVALCSTALTGGHLALLKRCEAQELVLLLDGDEAGRKAVERLAGVLLAAGWPCKVALLPEGDDPDTFARREGESGVRTVLDEALPLTAHLFRAVLPEGPDATFEAKMRALERLRPTCAQLPVGLTRSAFFGALSKHFGLPASELEATLRGKAPPVKPVPKPSQPAARRTADRPAAPPPAEHMPDPLEALFAAFVLRDRRLWQKDPFRLVDELKHVGLRTLLAAIGSGRSAEDALYDASGPTKAALEQATRQLPVDDGQLERAFVAACRRLKVRRIEEQLSYIAHVTARLAGATDLDEETKRLLAERSDLLALKRKVLEEPP